MNNQKSLKFVFLKIILSLAVMLGLVIYLNKSSLRIAKEINQKNHLKAKMNNQSLFLSQLENEYKRLEPGWLSFKEIFPSRENMDRVLEALENLAERTGNIQKINFLNEKLSAQNNSIKDKKNIPLELNLIGKLDSIQNYLIGLDNIKFYVTIESVEITSAANSLAINSNAKISLRIYTKD